MSGDHPTSVPRARASADRDPAPPISKSRTQATAPHLQHLPTSFDSLYRMFWTAVFFHIRQSGYPPETAKDLTQTFLGDLCARGWRNLAERQRGRFRPFLMMLLQRYLKDMAIRDADLARGGIQAPLPLDEILEAGAAPCETEFARDPAEELDHRDALTLLESSLHQLRSEAESKGEGDHFGVAFGQLFGEAGDPPGKDVAQHTGSDEHPAVVRVRYWRNRYREMVRAEVARKVPRSASLDEELHHLLAAASE